MKLDTEKKVLLCQKALYSKQLLHYRELCAIYKDLATIAVRKYQFKNTPEASISAQVQDFYARYLSKATRGDLSFLDNDQVGNSVRFDRDQIALLKKYARASERVYRFQEASEKLHDATYYNGQFDIGDKELQRYHDFMQSDNETKSFDKFISENSKRWIGHISYRRSVTELSKIRDIDANHVAILSGKSITPKSFGATITGARGNIFPVKKNLQQDIENIYTQEEQEKFKNDPSNLESIGEAAYVLGYRAKESTKSFYHAHKGSLQNALKKLAIIGLAVGAVHLGAQGVNKIGDAIEFNSQVYNNNPAYVQTIDADTQAELNKTGAFLDELENQSYTPTSDQLMEAKNMVDDEINLVLGDLVRNSFHENYPNLIIPEGGVVIHYNDHHIDPESGKQGNYIYINCHDVNGKPYQFTIENFSSQGEDRTTQAFRDERAVDDLEDDISASHSGNFKENTMSIEQIIDELQEIHENTLKLAGAEGSVDIPEANYANKKAVDKENVFDLFKAKVSESSVFLLKPEFKLVIPEKTNVQITPSTNIELDDDGR